MALSPQSALESLTLRGRLEAEDVVIRGCLPLLKELEGGEGLAKTLLSQIQAVDDAVLPRLEEIAETSSVRQLMFEEPFAVRRAAQQTLRLIGELGIRAFRDDLQVGIRTQFVLEVLDGNGNRAVLKVYGKDRPDEAGMQRRLTDMGVDTCVKVLDAGEAPTSWLLLECIPGGSLGTTANDWDVCEVTESLARQMAEVHVDMPSTPGARTLAEGIHPHLFAVTDFIVDNGYGELLMPDWQDFFEETCALQPERSLHGDLHPNNIMRKGLRTFDYRGYRGPAAFDDALHSATTNLLQMSCRLHSAVRHRSLTTSQRMMSLLSNC